MRRMNTASMIQCVGVARIRCGGSPLEKDHTDGCDQNIPCMDYSVVTDVIIISHAWTIL